MSASIIDYHIDKGSTFSTKINLKLNDTGLDLSLYTFRGSVLNNDVLTPFTIVESSNDITVSLTSAQTSALAKGLGVYDIEMVEDLTGNVTKIIKGRIFIDEEVTI
jgi:hypothetical protein